MTEVYMDQSYLTDPQRGAMKVGCLPSTNSSEQSSNLLYELFARQLTSMCEFE